VIRGRSRARLIAAVAAVIGVALAWAGLALRPLGKITALEVEFVGDRTEKVEITLGAYEAPYVSQRPEDAPEGDDPIPPTRLDDSFRMRLNSIFAGNYRFQERRFNSTGLKTRVLVRDEKGRTRRYDDVQVDGVAKALVDLRGFIQELRYPDPAALHYGSRTYYCTLAIVSPSFEWVRELGGICGPRVRKRQIRELCQARPDVQFRIQRERCGIMDQDPDMAAKLKGTFCEIHDDSALMKCGDNFEAVNVFPGGSDYPETGTLFVCSARGETGDRRSFDLPVKGEACPDELKERLKQGICFSAESVAFRFHRARCRFFDFGRQWKDCEDVEVSEPVPCPPREPRR
jgi:hypothetical protein